MDIKDIKVGKKYWYNGERCWVTVDSIDDADDLISCHFENGTKKGSPIDCVANELERPYTTVGELIEKLKQFDPDMGCEVKAFWRHSHNFCTAHKQYWESKFDYGENLCVCEEGNSIVIENEDADDYDNDED